MSQASERERVILDLLNSLTELGFDIDDCVFEFDPELQRWIVSDSTHAADFSQHAEMSGR